MINTEKNARRDWTLLIFIIPVGILLIILVGQLAIRLVPSWRVDADMNSNLEPNASSARPFALLEPILPQILTPMAWAESYLTPGAVVNFPPFLTFEPSATPSPTTGVVTSTTETPTVTATTPSPLPTGSATTPPPKNGGDSSSTPPATCQDRAADNFGGSLPCDYTSTTTCQDRAADNFGGSLPCDYTSTTTCQDQAADNFGGSLPCDYTSTTTCQDQAADNFGGSLPCDYTSTTTCQDQAANNYGGLLPCIYSVVSTIDPTIYGTPVTPIPTEIGSAPDNSAYEMLDSTYLVLGLTLVVGSTPDNNYDLVLYEYRNNGTVYLDWTIVGITNNSDGSQYYEVFNWGNNIRDKNTNVDTANLTPSPDCTANTECDDRQFDPSDPNGLHDGTGVLIDVDKADSNPPPNTYNYVVIISPPGGSGIAGGTQIDAVVATEVPIPTPTP